MPNIINAFSVFVSPDGKSEVAVAVIAVGDTPVYKTITLTTAMPFTGNGMPKRAATYGDFNDLQSARDAMALLDASHLQNGYVRPNLSKPRTLKLNKALKLYDPDSVRRTTTVAAQLPTGVAPGWPIQHVAINVTPRAVAFC